MIFEKPPIVIPINQSDWRLFFYRTASNAEIDLVLEKGRRRIAIEIKTSTSPQVKHSFWTAIDDFKIDVAWIIAPVDTPYPYKQGVSVIPLNLILSELDK